LAWRYEEVAEEADFFGLEELKQLASAGAQRLVMCASEREARERQQREDWAEQQQRIRKFMAPLAPQTPARQLAGGSGATPTAAIGIVHGPDGGGATSVPTAAATPTGGVVRSSAHSLSPTLNFTMAEDF